MTSSTGWIDALPARPAGRGALRLAHRGDGRRAPENTLPALLAALDAPGCDGVEFDVRAARDGTPVLLHDRTLWRVQGRPDAVAALSAGELADVGVPRLETVLDALPRKAFLDIELKDDPGDGVIDVLDAARGRPLDNGVVSSFRPATIARIRRARPEWPTWLNTHHLCHALVGRAARLGCTGVSVRWPAVNARSMAAARNAGLEVAAWTARRPGTRDALSRLGVMAVCVEAAALDA